MRHYDHIVVGGGASGLTVTLLLALQGRRVLLLEKAPRLGGALARFRRGRIPFDVGFHFTGGFGEDSRGMLDDMLTVMGIRDRIVPIFAPEARCHRIAFPSTGDVHEIPSGILRYRDKLRSDFPSDSDGIETYFERFLHVCRETASMDLLRLSERTPALEEDFRSLQDMLDRLIGADLLKTILSVFCLCHGTRPCEISFANHCRLAFGLYESTARVANGGDTFVRAFEDAFKPLDVEVRLGTTLRELADFEDRKVRRFILSDGEEAAAETCVLAIHPLNILEILPRDRVSPAFRQRIEGLEPTLGFFSVFCRQKDGPVSEAWESSVFSLLPNADLNEVMTPEWPGERPMVMLFGHEEVNGRAVKTATALEASFYEDVARWGDTTVGRRGKAYLEYKERRTASIRRRLLPFFPSLAEDMQVLGTASMLTFRDYLNAPFGAAYGIKQKLGQFNLMGKLPIHNLYAAGQCAILPGVLGAMTSDFFVVRAILGREKFQSFIEGNLCR